MSTPEILPREQQLENLINEFYDEIKNTIADDYKKLPSFIDEQFEERHPPLLRVIEKVGSSFMNGDTVSEDLYRALYQAFYFAYAVAKTITVYEHPEVVVSDYYNQPWLYETMQTEAAEYLSSRPATNGMIDAFMDSIDQSKRYPEAARTMAAITFKQIEEGERQRYSDRVLDEIEIDLS